MAGQDSEKSFTDACGDVCNAAKAGIANNPGKTLTACGVTAFAALVTAFSPLMQAKDGKSAPVELSSAASDAQSIPRALADVCSVAIAQQEMCSATITMPNGQTYSLNVEAQSPTRPEEDTEVYQAEAYKTARF